MNIFQHFLKTKTVKAKDDESFSLKDISLLSGYRVAISWARLSSTHKWTLWRLSHGNSARMADSLWKYCYIHWPSCPQYQTIVWYNLASECSSISDCRFTPPEKWAKRQQKIKLRLRLQATLNWICRKISKYTSIKRMTVLSWLCCLHQGEEPIPACHRIWSPRWITRWPPHRTSQLQH